MNVKVDKIFSEMILEKLNSGEIGINNFESIKYFPCDSHENIFNISDKILKFKLNKGLVEDNLKNIFMIFLNFCIQKKVIVIFFLLAILKIWD